MGKNYDALQYLATTGTGIAIGTDIDLAGIFRTSDAVAGTIIMKTGATVLFTVSASSLYFTTPVSLTGPITATSSAGGGMTIIFRKRAV